MVPEVGMRVRVKPCIHSSSGLYTDTSLVVGLLGKITEISSDYWMSNPISVLLAGYTDSKTFNARELQVQRNGATNASK
jgi:hypothetical protein